MCGKMIQILKRVLLFLGRVLTDFLRHGFRFGGVGLILSTAYTLYKGLNWTKIVRIGFHGPEALKKEYLRLIERKRAALSRLLIGSVIPGYLA